MKWPRLVPEWRRCWRMASVLASLALAVASGVQADVLPLVQPLFAPETWPYVSGGWALAIVLLRLLHQGLAQPIAPAPPAPPLPPPPPMAPEEGWPRASPSPLEHLP